MRNIGTGVGRYMQPGKTQMLSQYMQPGSTALLNGARRRENAIR